MFLLRNICEKFDIDISYTKEITNIDELKDNMIQWVSNKDLRSISQWILNFNKHTITLVDIYDISLDIFNNLTKSKLMKEFDSALTLNINMNPNIILLSKIVTLFSNYKKGKNFSAFLEVKALADIENLNILKIYFDCNKFSYFYRFE
jgi:hypothetical protein